MFNQSPFTQFKSFKRDVLIFKTATLVEFTHRKKIDETLRINGLIRGSATSEANNCLLDSIYQTIIIYFRTHHPALVPLFGDVKAFIQSVRTKINKDDESRLSINDEVEGLQILTAIQSYLIEKTNKRFNFNLMVFIADSDGEVGIVDTSSLSAQIDGEDGAIPIKIIFVNYNHYEPLSDTLTLHPNQDALGSTGLSWIHKTGGRKNISIEEVSKLTPKPEGNLDSIVLMNSLLELLCKEYSDSFWKKKYVFKSIALNFLDGKNFEEKSSLAISEWVRFYGHLTSFYLDFELTTSIDNQKKYIERGFITSDNKTTKVFRDQLPFLVMQNAQSQIEGMDPERALKSMYAVLKEIQRDIQHRSSQVANQLIPFLEKTIFLKHMGYSSKSNPKESLEYIRAIVEHCVRLPVNLQEKLFFHSGHHKHTFYVSMITNVKKNSIDIKFIINNFNTTALVRNQRVVGEENDFYPYVLKYKFPRTEGEKEKVRKKTDKEISELCFYIEMLQHSTVEGNHFFSEVSKQKPSGELKTAFRKICKIISKTSTLILDEIKRNTINKENYFSWILFYQYVTSLEFNIFLQQYIEDWDPSKLDELLTAHTLQFLQTLISLDIIYEPWKYGAKGFVRDMAFEMQSPSFSIQRIGNCTVYNLKMGLYPLAGLDWRNPEHLQQLVHLNLDISLMVIEIVKKTVPDITKRVQEALTKNIPYSLPSSSANTEIVKVLNLRAKKDYSNAKECIIKACKEFPNDGFAYATYALILDDTGEKNLALKVNLKALKIIDSPDIRVNTAILYSELGQSKEALEQYILALEAAPYSSLAYYNRAMLFYSLKDYQKCMDDIDKLIILEPSEPEYLLTKAQLLFDMNLKFEGIQYVSKAYDLGLRTNELYFTKFKFFYTTFISYYNSKKLLPLPNAASLDMCYKEMQELYELMRQDNDNNNNLTAVKWLYECRDILDDPQLLEDVTNPTLSTASAPLMLSEAPASSNDELLEVDPDKNKKQLFEVEFDI